MPLVDSRCFGIVRRRTASNTRFLERTNMCISQHFQGLSCCRLLGLGLIVLSGCQSSIPSMGPLLNQTPTRVPSPATGSFQTPTTYTPQSPTITGGTQGKVSATSHIKSDGWHSPETEFAGSESASPSTRTAAANIRNNANTTDPFSTVVPAGFKSMESEIKSIGTGVQSLPADENPEPETSGDSSDSNTESISDPRELKPVPAVNIQWRSPNK
jgi:hypothetical protein